MIRKLLIGLLLLTLILTGAAAAEDSLPLLPAQYFGTVTVDSQPAPVGLTITAKIGDDPAGSITLTEAGTFGKPGTFGEKLIVTPRSSDSVGKPVTFWIGNANATETVVLESGDAQKITLSFTGLIVTLTPQDSSTAPRAVEQIILISDTPLPADCEAVITDAGTGTPTLSAGYKNFKQMDISLVNIPASATVRGTIIFSMSKADISSLGATPETIRMLHGTTGSWTELTPVILAQDGTNVRYSIDVDGFSPFAIVTTVSTPSPSGGGGGGGSGGSGGGGSGGGSSGGGGGSSGSAGGSSSSWVSTAVPTSVPATPSPVVTSGESTPTVPTSGTPDATIPVSRKTPASLWGVGLGAALGMMWLRRYR